jgi:rod shape determining protein RodA
MWIVSRIPPKWLDTGAVWIYGFGVALLIAVAVFGLIKKGARRWLNVGIVIQPSELMKIAMPLMLAWYFQLREGIQNGWDYLVAAVILAIPVLLIARQPDLGTALLVFAAGLYVIICAGLPWRWILPVIGVLAVGVLLLIIFRGSICASDVTWPLLHGYQKNRICTLLDPSSDPLGKGFHTIQSVIAIGSGGFFGKGYGNASVASVESNHVPESETDFIFCPLAEEWGFFGSFTLICLFMFMLFRIVQIAERQKSRFNRVYAYCVAMILFYHFAVNIGMDIGFAPVIGIPLPFFSYGGSSMMSFSVMMFVLLKLDSQRGDVLG